MIINHVIICIVLSVFGCVIVDTIKIGAIFDTPSNYKKIAFQLAIEELNNKYSNGHNLEIEPVELELSMDNPLSAMQATLDLAEQGVVGVLGPSLEHNVKTVQSICDENDISYLDVRWVDEPMASTINFYPSQNALTQLYIDIITAWEYTDFVILYDNNSESLKRVARLVETFDHKNHTIVLRQLDNNKNHRPVLKEALKSGIVHLVLDCSTENLEEVLRQAQQVGLMSNKHYYFITNLDLHTLDLTQYRYSETNITGLRIFDPLAESISHLSERVFEQRMAMGQMFSGWTLQLDTILVVDAIMIFGEVVLRKLDNDPKFQGLTITNILKGMKHSGYSGMIGFDGTGYRSGFDVDVIELKEKGIAKVGNWSIDKKLIINRPYDKDKDGRQTLKDKSFRVLISLMEPFAMYTPTETRLLGNNRYQGYAIDLIHELSIMEGFNYTFINQEDKDNGDCDLENRKWTGMIGKIIDDEADLAIADLTITSKRQKCVDFTTPFMNLGISILYQKPRKAPPSFFSFADPFGLEVWMLVALSYFTVGIVLFILGRICSSEWVNPYPCIEEPEFLENQLSLRNCFWFVSGSIMQQGTEIGPIGLSTRMVAGIWWFFTLIMVSSYTANLAAFLTRETPIPHFTNVYELVANAAEKNIKWGAKKGGTTVPFFNTSRGRVPEYGKIFDYMMEHEKDVLVTDPIVGVNRAEVDNYAFFMEITSIEYEIQRRCNLTAVGKLLDEKSYGIAMKKNSTYRNVLSRAILNLQHTGKLNELKRQWWEEKRGGGFCENEDDQADATALNLKNVGGVFWVSIGGASIGILLVVAELVLHVVKLSIITKAPLKKSILEEFKFYFKFSGMVKPVTNMKTDTDVTSRKSSEEK